MRKLKLFSLLAGLLLSVGTMYADYPVVDSGNCGADGDNLTWVLYELTHSPFRTKLVISGTGAMKDYDNPSPYIPGENKAPWGLMTDVKEIELPEGLTHIGNWALYGNMAEVLVVPSTVKSIGNHAFSVNTVLDSLSLPEGLESIGDEAFASSTWLRVVEIPSTVTHLGNAFMKGCNNLQRFLIRDGNTTWETPTGSNALITKATPVTLVYGCKKTTIPNYVKVIGERAFEGQTEITSITIPNGVTTISADAFNGCYGLTSIEIPASVNNISSSAFFACKFSTISVANGNTVYDSRDNCNALIETSTNTLFLGCKNSTIPEGVEIIGASAFAFINNLTSITIPSTVKSLDMMAFYGCGLTELTCKATTPPTVGINAFGALTNTIPVYVPEASLTAYQNDEKWRYFTNILPIGGSSDSPCADTDEYRGTCGANLNWILTCSNNLIITGTGAMADYTSESHAPWYAHKADISSIILPEGLTKIGDYAFDGLGNKVVSLTCDATTPPTVGNNAFGSIPANISVIVPDVAIVNYSNSEAWCYFDDIRNAIQPCNNSGDYSGTCGENLSWVLSCGGKLVITGTGPMYDFSTASQDYEDKMAPWYKKRHEITSVYLPEGITHIGRIAFYATDITSVDIPASVISIGNSAFSTCHSLKSFNIPSNSQLQSIGTGAIEFAIKLESPIIIPASVTSIGEGFIAGCDALREIVVAEGNTVYDSRNNCNAIIRKSDNALIAGCASSVIPNGVAILGSSAFLGLDDIVKKDIPESVVSIESLAFSGCSHLDSIILPAGLKNIGGRAFANTDLTIITCYAINPPQLFSQEVFDAVENNIPVYVPASSVEAYKADAGWSYFTNILPIPSEGPQPCEDTYEYRGVCGEHLSWVLTCDGELVITGAGMMYDFEYPTYGPWHSKRDKVKSISLPNGLTYIGQYAFYMMDEIDQTVVVPEGVTSIGYCAFSGQRKLPAITLPNSLKSIAASAFSSANVLTSLHIPANVNNIGTGITEECEALETITVDPANETFDSRDNCNAIIKKSTATLVAGCKTTVIPNTVTTIGAWAFSSIKTLTSLNLPASITTLQEYAFQYCSNLKKLVIPSKVSFISGTAFTGCDFDYITVHPANETFDSRDNCLAVIETASNTLIKGCSKTVIPDEVKVLGEGAFMSNKGLKFINIPANVERIKNNALIYCNKLEAITCFAAVPPTAEGNAFNYGAESSISIPSNIPVYVPAASIDLYRNADKWNYFTNFVALDGGDKTYYTVKALANHGIVNGTGTYEAGTEISLTPIADDGYEFKQWSDGTTTTPKNLKVTKDMTIRAMFEKKNQEEKETAVSKCVGLVYINFQPTPETEIYVIEVITDGELWEEIKLKGDGTIKDDTKASSAPSRMKVRKAKKEDDKISVELSNIEAGLDYTFTIDAYDANDNCLSAHAGSFNTADVIMGDESTAEEIETILSNNNGKVVEDMSIIRTVVRNGYFNTLCLPFSMNAEQIANSSLATAEIKEFVDAEVAGDVLNITFSPVTEIVAGKPYFIRYSSADALDRLNMSNVTINAAAPEAVSYNGIQMIGTYVPKAVDPQTSATGGEGVLFLGAENTLFWPNVAGNIKPFRCYFKVSLGSSAGAPKRGMPARIIEREKMPTAIENIKNDAQKFNKTIENGMLIIEKNGVKFNAQGQIVK